MGTASLHGPMESFIKGNSLITASPAKVSILGPMAADTKGKFKMASDTDSASIASTMQPMRGSGSKAKSKGKEKLFSKVVAYLKVNSKTILSMDMEKCTIILLGTFLKANGLRI